VHGVYSQIGQIDTGRSAGHILYAANRAWELDNDQVNHEVRLAVPSGESYFLKEARIAF
jgi:hypothetical protein